MKPNETHNTEITKNKEYWEKKPVLRRIYLEFYQLICSHLKQNATLTVEIGSGIGNLKSLVPNCICTDMFNNPWLDQVENAYQLSFEDNTIDNLVLFDVWHHLQYPGTILEEFHRVLKPKGRIIIFEPDISLMGRIAYGLLHHEPLGLNKEINWYKHENEKISVLGYYAAQGNANRIFVNGEHLHKLKKWRIIQKKRIASFSYIASGGYSKPQLYPSFLYPALRQLDKLCCFIPSLFSVRLLVVLEKQQ